MLLQNYLKVCADFSFTPVMQLVSIRFDLKLEKEKLTNFKVVK